MRSRIAKRATTGVFRGWVVGVVCVALLPRCGGGASASYRPQPSLSESLSAQAGFGPIREEWLLSSRSERAVLGHRLRVFRQRHAEDPLARVADAYLAILALDRGDEAEARRLAAGIANGPQGNTTDLGVLVQGVSLSRRGKANDALAKLTPLIGKLIDPFAQDLLHESVAEAGVQAQRWFMAVQTMNDWLKSTTEAQLGPVRARVNALLKRFPAPALEQTLRAVRLDRDREVWGKEIRHALAARLARVAMERADPRLARSVLETSRTVIQMEEDGDSLAALAASGGDAARISGSRVGLVLPTASDQLRRRGGEALAGALEVFQPRPGEDYVPGAPADEAPMLVVREQSGEAHALDEAIRALEAEGVALVIAGFDVLGASVAASSAEARGLPVVLLTAPERPPASSFAFVLGERDPAWGSDSPQATAAGARGHSRMARVAMGVPPAGSAGATCAEGLYGSGDTRFPLPAWRAQGITAILMDGPSWCAKDLLRELATSGYRPSIWKAFISAKTSIVLLSRVRVASL
ncbi:MAG: hypothetical protein MUF54_20590 [Polyangiaceae bacterium]|nr:hypothetical protein [Polyangiaceae bacterium]